MILFVCSDLIEEQKQKIESYALSNELTCLPADFFFELMAKRFFSFFLNIFLCFVCAG